MTLQTQFVANFFGSTSTYYVDATGGNDGANGRTPSTAWKTISKVHISTFRAGSVIKFKKGEIWRERLDVPSSHITLDAYGTGSNPIISGANLLSSGWTNVGNVWSVSCTTQPYNVFMNNTRGTLKANAGALSAEFDWFWATNVLKIYSPSSPSVRYTTPGVEAANRYAAIDTDSQNYLHFSNLTFEKANKTGGENGYGLYIHHSHHVTTSNCTCKDNYNSGIKVYGDETSNINTFNCVISGNGVDGYSEVDIYSFNTVRSCTVYSNGWQDDISNGIIGAFINGAVLNNIVYSNGLGDHNINLSHGIYITDNTGTATVDGNTSYSNRASGIQCRSSCTISNNICHDNNMHGIVVGDCSTDMIAVVHHNISYGNKYGISAGKYDTAGNVSLKAYNNTLYGNNNVSTSSDSPGGLHIDTDNLTLLDFRNNIVVALSTNYAYYIDAVQTHATFDYNNVYRSSGGSMMAYHISQDSLRTWEEWQSLGFDTHSTNTDPLLSNPTSDFSLQSRSPNIDSGVIITNITDGYLGVAPDLGAEEKA